MRRAQHPQTVGVAEFSNPQPASHATQHPIDKQGSRDAESLDKMLVKNGDNIILVSTREILWIQSNRNWIRIHSKNADYDCRMTMADAQQRLPRSFLRIHRNAIVNLTHASAFTLPRSGDAFVSLDNGKTLPVSRSGRSAVRRYLLSFPCF
jgi:DNA-binding LytR/AlgR family response regulator